MFWDCLTCDFSFYLRDPEKHPHVKQRILREHEIYHHLWLGCEIDLVTGDVISEQ